MLADLADRVAEEALHHGQLPDRVRHDDLVHGCVEGLAERAEQGRRAVRAVQRQPAPVPVVAHAQDVAGALQPVHDGRGRAGGDAEALAEITGCQRTAGPVAVDDGEQRGPVGRMHAVPFGEGPSELHGLDHIALQQPDQLGTGVGRGAGRGVHGRALYSRPTSLSRRGN